MSKVTVRYEDGTEENLTEYFDDNNGVRNIYHQNKNGDFLTQHLPPFARMQVHNLSYGGYLLGDRFVEVIRCDYP